MPIHYFIGQHKHERMKPVLSSGTVRNRIVCTVERSEVKV